MTFKGEVILPKEFRLPAVRQEMGRELLKIAEDMRKDFEKTTSTWRHRPAMVIQRGNWLGLELPSHFNVHVGPDPADENSRIYQFVDLGTRPHTIRPKRARALAFIWGGPGSYQPKTRPLFLTSTSGGPTGGLVFARQVHHPGTQPRRFSQLLAWKWQANTNVRMIAATQRGVAASGHKYP